MSKDQPSPESQLDIELDEDVVEQAAELDNEEAEVVEELEAAEAELSVEELQKQLAKAENKATENWDKVLRIQAEMDNLKRRTQKDLDSAHKYGLEKFAKELLGVIDSLELGIQAATSDVPEVVKLKEGSELTVKQFEAVFAKFNIEAIDPVGQPFAPEFHQAMTMVPSADAEPNTVVNVFQKGYVLNGRLIRPAMVVVAQASA
ncbi:nucleotide exchange factor GrpE [Methyloprofundus sp.]|uniref:nucleotide exchange factor GrpE n=1 Tax=Methyloprofundus sp. TaxID=2020875 RepID=UPI003D09DAF8